ncbi:MAG: replication initiator protein A [Chloroflexota bacterium]
MTKTAHILLPDRHPNRDFFICDILDAVPKDDMASMEHPIFSLSTKPDTRIRQYENNGNSIQIAPSVLGLATIHDKDILIYCISQLMTKLNKGEQPNRTIRLKAHDLLVATNRQTSGRGYKLLRDAFERLAGTRITTDITTNGEQEVSGFGLVDAWRITVKDQKTLRMVEIEVMLSHWMYNSVLGNEVLTISKDYFRLRKPLERRVYEIARKHCGQQCEWAIALPTLQKKCGSSGDLREFRRMVRTLVKHDHLPDYHVTMNSEDTVQFRRRGKVKQHGYDAEFPILRPDTYEAARKAAPNYDVYVLEQDWRGFWIDSGKPHIANPDAAFVGFCKRRYQRNTNLQLR